MVLFILVLFLKQCMDLISLGNKYRRMMNGGIVHTSFFLICFFFFLLYFIILLLNIHNTQYHCRVKKKSLITHQIKKTFCRDETYSNVLYFCFPFLQVAKQRRSAGKRPTKQYHHVLMNVLK